MTGRDRQPKTVPAPITHRSDTGLNLIRTAIRRINIYLKIPHLSGSIELQPLFAKGVPHRHPSCSLPIDLVNLVDKVRLTAGKVLAR